MNNLQAYLFLTTLLFLVFATIVNANAEKQTAWQDVVLSTPYPVPERRPLLQLVRQDFERLEFNRSVISSGEKKRVKGQELMKQFLLTISERHRSEVITYRKVEK